MQSKLNIKHKSEPSTSDIIINKAVESLGNKPTHQKQNIMNGVDRHEMIAMAAYYRAERRCFNSGNEIQDWLEAEAEIDGLI